jgi:NlpC/P60 family putative phage cell wall peptidase
MIDRTDIVDAAVTPAKAGVHRERRQGTPEPAAPPVMDSGFRRNDGERSDRGQIVAEALSWLGTPYHHGQSVKGTGCDCLGLVRGVWRAAIGPEPETLPAYSRDWGIGEETLLDGARRHFVEIPVARIAGGDVVVFRMRRGRPAKHCAIVVIGGEGELRFVHAWDAAPMVCSSLLDEWWWARVAAVLQFPGIA